MREKLTDLLKQQTKCWKRLHHTAGKEATGMMMLKGLGYCWASFYEAQENKDLDAKQHSLGGSLYID